MLTANILRIKDETAMGQIMYEFDLPLNRPQVSVKDIISERVKLEIENYSNEKPSQGHSLFKVSEMEKTLNQHEPKTPLILDIKKQVAIALRAFEGNEYFIIIGKAQVESLEQRVDIKENLSVSFMKLVPIVGG
ncbi:MAG: hypothetical protein KAG19_05185 [Methylococcales bacterium]|nr:hypothetical protein [Methylococcales bacterium]